MNMEVLSEVGSYKTVGYLQYSWNNPRIYLSVVGVFAFFIVFIGVGLVLPEPYFNLYFIPMVQVSIALTIISLIALGFFTLTTPPQGIYELTVFKTKNDGKKKLSYTDPKGRQKTNLEVRKSQTYPNAPMPKKAQGFPTTGTRSSMYLCFQRPRLTMWLGFPDSQELDRFVSLLA